MFLFISPTFLPTVAGTELELAKLARTVGVEKCVFLLPSYLRDEAVRNDFRVIYFPKYIIYCLLYFSKVLASRWFCAFAKKRLDLNEFERIFLIFLEPTISLTKNFIRGYENKVTLVPQGGDVKKALYLDSLYDTQINSVYYMSLSMRKDLMDLGFGENTLKYVPTGTDIDYLRSFVEEDNVKGVLSRYGINSSDFIVLTVSRNVPKKGLEDIPEIIRLIRDDIPLKWIVIGLGSDKLKSDPRLITLPPIPVTNPSELPPKPLAQIYAAADLYVATSKSEGLSLVTLDQLAIGNQILAYDGDGVREIFTEDARLPKVGDVVSLAGLIMDFYDHGTFPKTIENIESYSWRSISQRYFDL